MFGNKGTKRKIPETPEEMRKDQERKDLNNHRMNDYVLPLDNNKAYEIPTGDVVKDYPFVQLLMDQGFSPLVYRLHNDSVAVYVPRYVDVNEENELVQELEHLNLTQFLWGRLTRRLFTYINKDPPPPAEDKKQEYKVEYYKRGPKKGTRKPLPKKKSPKQAFPPRLRVLSERLEPIAGLPLNKALVNKYRKDRYITKKGEWTQGAGKDNMPPHRDSECIFGKDKPIVSISLGRPRLFYIQHEEQGALCFKLGEGDLLLMTPELNTHCVHWVPNEVELQPLKDRWNITFRSVIPKK